MIGLIIEMVVSVLILGLNATGIFKNSKYNTPTKTLSLISSILVIGYVVYRLMRRYIDTINFISARKFVVYPLYAIVLALTITIISLISLPIDDRDDRDDKDDKDDKDKKDDTNWEIVLDVVIGLIAMGLIVGALYLFFKYDMKLISIILLIVGILVAVLYYSIYYGTKKVEVRTRDSNLDVKYPQPKLKQMKLKELKKLLKNLGDFKMDNECKIYDQTDCNYLYKQYIASGGDDNILKELLDKLSSMKKKDGTVDKTPLINQAIFIIYQLLQCNIDLDYKDTIYRFGTWEWWTNNIFMRKADEDPMQRYIWVISFIVCVIFFFYNLWEYWKNKTTIFNDNLGWSIGGFVMILVQTVVVIGLIISQLTMAQSERVDKPVDKEYQKYERSYDPISPDPADPKQKYDPSPVLSHERTGLIGLFSYLGALLVATIMSYMGGDSIWGKGNKIFALSGIIGLVMAFNAYYMTLIPQLAIIGIIIQKYILSTSLTDNLLATIVKGIIVVAVLFASFYDTTYNIKEKSQEVRDTDVDVVTGVSGAYNKPVWYIFGILMALLLQNGFESFTGFIYDYEDDKWSLILMPLARYFLNIISEKDIPYSAVSISNKF